jgi:hypothetical protein
MIMRMCMGTAIIIKIGLHDCDRENDRGSEEKRSVATGRRAGR